MELRDTSPMDIGLSFTCAKNEGDEKKMCDVDVNEPDTVTLPSSDTMDVDEEKMDVDVLRV